MKKPTGKRYEIDSFKKLCNIINDDNYEQITTDLCHWLGFHISIMRDIRKKHPKETKGKTNWELAQTSFIWIDDGKNDLKAVLVKNKDTGETNTIKLVK